MVAGAIGKILNMVGKEVVKAQASWMKFENTVNQTYRSVGYTGQRLQNLTNQSIINVKRWGLAYGATKQEIDQVNKSITQLTNTAQEYSSRTRESMLAAQKLGLNFEEFAKSTSKFGMGVQSSMAWLAKGATHAKTLGLNTQAFTNELTKGVHLMQKMTFQGGINGLEKMTGLAMRLGTSVEALTKHIDIDNGAFSDIGKSIEAASKLQMLGGTFAQNFSNPIEVMGEAMTDAESAMNRVINSLSGKGTFNRSTGQVDMNWMDKKSIGIAAQALGMDANELRTAASNQVKAGAIRGDLKKSGKLNQFSDSQLDAITNLADFNADTGKFEVTYTNEAGDSVKTSLENLNAEGLNKILDLKEQEKNIDGNVMSIAGHVREMTDMMKGNAKETTSAAEAVAGGEAALEAGKTQALAFRGNGVKGVQGFANNLSGWIDSGWEKVKSWWPFANGGIVPKVDAKNKFDGGGVVDGTSYTGDKVPARLNSGEMVLNAAQQAMLFKIATGNMRMPSAWKSGKSATKWLGQMGKLGKSAAVVKYLPTRALSNKNLAARFARMKLRSYGDEGKYLARGWEKAAGFADNVRSMPGRAMRATGRGISRGASWVGGKSVQAAKGISTAVSNGITKAVGAERIASLKAAASKQAAALKNSKAMQKAASMMSKAGNQMSKAGGFIAKGGKAFGGYITKFGGVIGKTVKSVLTVAGRIGGQALSAGANFMGGYDDNDYDSDADDRTKKKKKGKKGKRGGKRGGRKGGKFKPKKLGNKLLNKVAKKAGGKLMAKTGAKLAAKTGAKLAAKTAAKAIPGVGTALSVGMEVADSISQASSAISNYKEQAQAIESRTDLSKEEKEKLLNNAKDERNGAVGGAVGQGVGALGGAAIGASIGAALGLVGMAVGGALGAAVGAIAGSKVGKAIGKVVGKVGRGIKNAAKAVGSFLFGSEKKAEDMSEEDKAQQKYEETKLGQVSIDDPQLMEKAAMATCQMHDLLISIWHHMNGKLSNGEEKGKEGILKTAGKGILGLVSAPFKAIGSLFGKKNKEEAEKDGKVKKKDSENDRMLKFVEAIHKNLAAFVQIYGVKPAEVASEEGKDGESKTEKAKNALKTVAKGMFKASTFGLGSTLFKKFKEKKEGNEKSLKEQAEEVKAATSGATSSISIDDPQLMLKAAVANCETRDTIKLIWEHLNGGKGETSGKVESQPTSEEIAEGSEDGESKTESVITKVKNFRRGLMRFALGPFGKLMMDGEKPPVQGKGLLKRGLFGVLGHFFGDNGEVKAEEGSDIEPKPIGEEKTTVKDTTTTDTTQTTATTVGSDTIKLEVSGTLRLESNGQTGDVDINKLLESPEVRQKLIDIVYEGLNARAGGGRMDKNTERAVKNGANNR